MSEAEKVEKVTVRHGEASLEVAPEFYDVARCLLSIGFGAVDVFRDDSFVSVVFLSYAELEYFSSFLLTHRLFGDDGMDGTSSVHGNFMLTADRELEPCFFVNIPEDKLAGFESVLLSHAPAASTASS